MENPFRYRYKGMYEDGTEGNVEKKDEAIEKEIDEELKILKENADALQKDLEEIDEEQFEKLDDEQKKNTFSAARRLILTLSALASMPLIGSILKPELAEQINKLWSDFVNNNFKEIMMGIGVASVLLLGKPMYDIIKEKISEHRKER